MSVMTRSAPHVHRGAWMASLGLVVLLLLFVGLIAILAPGLPIVTQPAQLAIGIVVALVPALIWLAFFLLQDRLEPEPTVFVLQLCGLGALVALALGVPLVRDVFHLNRWLYTNTWTHLAGSVLVAGFIQEFLIFAAVRFSVFSSPEFSERTDGIMYATAAALGFATMLNFDYVISRGGVDLAVGAARVTVTALAHASIAGVLGYFLGQAKFEHKSSWYMPGALVIAALLNGLFFFAQDVVTRRGLIFNPFYGLGVAAVMALVLLGVVTLLIRRSQAETIALTAQAVNAAGSNDVPPVAPVRGGE